MITPNDPRLAKAIAYAAVKHAVQKDKGGQPYIAHLMRVMLRTIDKVNALPEGAMTEEEKIETIEAAILHDVVEDFEFTGVTVEDLIAEGFSEGTIRRVKRLSGKHGMTYQENIKAMATEGDLGTMLIKLSDNEDNSDPARIAALPEEERSISNRYERSKDTLRWGIEERLAQAA